LADRLDRKLLTVSVDCLNGLFLIGVFVFTRFFGTGISVLYVGTAVLTALTTVYDIGLEAAIPNIVTREKLMAVNSVSKIIYSATSIFGPVAGGLIYAFFDIRYLYYLTG